MEEIRAIHEESHEIYGAPKIAEKMRQNGDRISDRTVGSYMREMGLGSVTGNTIPGQQGTQISAAN